MSHCRQISIVFCPFEERTSRHVRSPKIVKCSKYFFQSPLVLETFQNREFKHFMFFTICFQRKRILGSWIILQLQTLSKNNPKYVQISLKLLKFRYCKKVTKFEDSPTSKSGRFFQIFVAFQSYVNLTIFSEHVVYCFYQMIICMEQTKIQEIN